MRVQQSARRFVYPPTPNVNARLKAAQRPNARPSAARRWAQAAAALLLITLAALAVPGIRAAVIEFLQIGAVRIFSGPPTATPTGVPDAFQPGAEPYSSVLQLPGAMALPLIRERVAFPIRLPTYPPGVGAPDRSLLLRLERPIAVLIWLDPQDASRVLFSLHLIDSGDFAGKFSPAAVQHVRVGSRPAAWISEPHIFGFYRIDGQTAARQVQDHVLLWQDGGVTYRLETPLALDDAIRIAESLE